MPEVAGGGGLGDGHLRNRTSQVTGIRLQVDVDYTNEASASAAGRLLTTT